MTAKKLTNVVHLGITSNQWLLPQFPEIFCGILDGCRALNVLARRLERLLGDLLRIRHIGRLDKASKPRNLEEETWLERTPRTRPRIIYTAAVERVYEYHLILDMPGQIYPITSHGHRRMDVTPTSILTKGALGVHRSRPLYDVAYDHDDAMKGSDELTRSRCTIASLIWKSQGTNRFLSLDPTRTSFILNMCNNIRTRTKEAYQSVFFISGYQYRYKSAKPLVVLDLLDAHSERA